MRPSAEQRLEMLEQAVFAEVGMLVPADARGGQAFALARRDWSAAPDTPSR